MISKYIYALWIGSHRLVLSILIVSVAFGGCSGSVQKNLLLGSWVMIGCNSCKKIDCSSTKSSCDFQMKFYENGTFFIRMTCDSTMAPKERGKYRVKNDRELTLSYSDGTSEIITMLTIVSDGKILIKYGDCTYEMKSVENIKTGKWINNENGWAQVATL